MTEYIIVEEGQEVYKQNISDEDIIPLLESGFVSSIFRLNPENGKIEYADIVYKNIEKDNVISTVPVISWEEPELKE